MIRGEVNAGGRLEHLVETSGYIPVCPPGCTTVILTAWPEGPCGRLGWTFSQTGTDEHGTPEGVAVAEPVSLLAWKKGRVVALETERASVLAAAASTGWDYSAELTTIDAEIEGLKL
jgi:hypothetical protein